MKEIQGNIWDFHEQGYIVIPTNGFVKVNGECVMGRGLAKQASVRHPSIPGILGSQIVTHGNKVFELPYQLYSFPVKHNWWEMADTKLIERSIKQLVDITRFHPERQVYIPRVGCGNGGLDWEIVKPILTPNLLWGRFTVVNQ